MNIDQVTKQQWTESRDQWYVNTLVEAGCHPSDILESKWEEHGISVRVDIFKGEEILCIKGQQIGQPHKLHPEVLSKIIADYNKSKLIVPDSAKGN